MSDGPSPTGVGWPISFFDVSTRVTVVAVRSRTQGRIVICRNDIDVACNGDRLGSLAGLSFQLDFICSGSWRPKVTDLPARRDGAGLRRHRLLQRVGSSRPSSLPWSRAPGATCRSGHDGSSSQAARAGRRERDRRSAPCCTRGMGSASSVISHFVFPSVGWASPLGTAPSRPQRRDHDHDQDRHDREDESDHRTGPSVLGV